MRLRSARRCRDTMEPESSVIVIVEVTASWLLPFHPRKDSICERREVPGIRFYLVNENAGVESDPAVTPEKNPEALYSQL